MFISRGVSVDIFEAKRSASDVAAMESVMVAHRKSRGEKSLVEMQQEGHLKSDYFEGRRSPSHSEGKFAAHSEAQKKAALRPEDPWGKQSVEQGSLRAETSTSNVGMNLP